jgi:hypothetical protein
MTSIRSLLLAGAVVLSATSAYAEGDPQDSARIKNSIYDVVRGNEDVLLQEGRSATEAPLPAAEQVQASEDSYFVEHPTEGDRNPLNN